MIRNRRHFTLLFTINHSTCHKYFVMSTVKKRFLVNRSIVKMVRHILTRPVQLKIKYPFRLKRSFCLEDRKKKKFKQF